MWVRPTFKAAFSFKCRLCKLQPNGAMCKPGGRIPIHRHRETRGIAVTGKADSVPESAVARAAQLRETIEHHNELYYVHAQTEISDQAFDALLKELIDLETQYPTLLTADSPTQRVGGRPLESFETVAHRVPMLSMDNTYSLDELRAFDERIVKLLKGVRPAYSAEPKIDGVSISILYEQGVFVRAVTRGDGSRGDDVTANVRTIRNLPLKLKGAHPPAVMEVRGEIYFRKLDFARINEQRDELGEIPFANPRNAAAGTLKMLDTREVARRPLRVSLYSLGYAEGVDVASHTDALDLFRKLNLPAVEEVATFHDIDALVQYVDDWETRR